MLPVQLIRKKRDCGALEDDEIRFFIAGVTDGSIPDYQVAAMTMAIFFNGLGNRELATWADAMTRSGDVIDLSHITRAKVDKHSTGGVGDKISIPLAPLVAACGVKVPMVSGRGLGHTGGTLDKLESIPGFRVDLSISKFEEIIESLGLCLIGQTAELAPADKKLYALRDSTATVESVPLIASSILSKKLAEGAGALVMDVKVGSGAFLPARSQARALAGALIDLGRRLGLRVRAVLSNMDQPLGLAIGNAVEVREAIDVLRGGGPPDVRALTVHLGAEMLVLGGVARDLRAGARRIEEAIASGAGLDRLRLGVGLQGGDVRAIDDPGRLPHARHTQVLHAPRTGVVTHVDAGALGRAATLLGVGRLRKEDRISPGAAILLHAKAGAPVGRGDTLCTIHYDDAARARAARSLAEAAFRIGSAAPRARPLVLETLG